MRVNRDQFLEEGYLVLRNVIPPEKLDALRTSYDILVNRQRTILAQEHDANNPRGTAWESSPQPRLNISAGAEDNPGLINHETPNAVEFWLHENTRGVSIKLMDAPDAAVTEMMLMCNPVRDHGPSNWHRDIHPIDSAPLEGYIRDIKENAPSYVQWNIPLYDDDVLWVVPGSHLRPNTEEENRPLLENLHLPIPSGVQTHLNAGDGVVYITPTLHWGSNYSTKLRRTIHGGFARWNRIYYSDLSFIQHLAPWALEIFERWADGSAKMQNHTEAALLAVIERDRTTFHRHIKQLYPDVGKHGRRLLTVFLCKAAYHIRCAKHPELEDVPTVFRNRGMRPQSTSLYWGPQFANRFSVGTDALLFQ